MVSTFPTFTVVAVTLFSVAHAAGPLGKRIAQTIDQSTAQWEQACLTAGGGQQCNPLSQTAFSTLLAAAGPCDQQNAGDQMIDLAHTLNNDADMIKFTQIFVQQPRNSPDSFQIPYCQQAPKNSELTGLFQCQFDGTKDTFTGNLAAGAAGTVPFGLSSLKTPRSCPANPSGGVADGTQLVAVTQDPGLSNIDTIGTSSGTNSGSNSGSSSSNSASGASSVVSATSTTASASSTASSGSDDGSGSCVPSTVTITVTAGSTATAASSGTASASTAAASSSSGTSSSSFALSNGEAAQKLNAQFASLTANSSCTANEQACIGSSFALCSNGAFVLMDCGASDDDVTCAALPLVNSAGTSVTCVSKADALQRIAATGAQGGLTGSN